MITIISKCKYCGKEIRRDFKTVREATINSRIPLYCNEEHKQLYSELKNKKSEYHPDFDCTPKKQPKLKYTKRTSLDPTMDICAVCRRNYKECERIRSDFTIIPEGARFNKQGKICDCPNFTL